MWFVIEGEQYGSQRKLHAQRFVKKSGRVVEEEFALVGQGPMEGAMEEFISHRSNRTIISPN